MNERRKRKQKMWGNTQAEKVGSRGVPTLPPSLKDNGFAFELEPGRQGRSELGAHTRVSVPSDLAARSWHAAAVTWPRGRSRQGEMTGS